MFVLLWSRNSKASDYVQQEMGIARGCNKTILPVVLEEGLTIPGFLGELKYLPAYNDYGQALSMLQRIVHQNATQQQQRIALLVGTVLLGIVCLTNDDNG